MVLPIHISTHSGPSQEWLLINISSINKDAFLAYFGGSVAGARRKWDGERAKTGKTDSYVKVDDACWSRPRRWDVNWIAQLNWIEVLPCASGLTRVALLYWINALINKGNRDVHSNSSTTQSKGAKFFILWDSPQNVGEISFFNSLPLKHLMCFHQS